MLWMFYESVVACVIFCAVVCWGGSMKIADTNRRDKLIRKAGSILGVELDYLLHNCEKDAVKTPQSWTIPPTHNPLARSARD